MGKQELVTHLLAASSKIFTTGTKEVASTTPLHLHCQQEKHGLRSRVFLVRYIQQEVLL